MTLAEATKISGVAALRDDSIHPPKLQFGNSKHIAARDMLALREEVEDLFSEVGHRSYPIDSVHAGSTKEELIDMRNTLRGVKERGW